MLSSSPILLADIIDHISIDVRKYVASRERRGGGIFPTGSLSILSVPLHLLIDNMDARVQLVTLSRRTVSSCPPRPSLDRRRRRVDVLMEFS